jgi:membrane associated rhomboid family serine protease
VEDQGARRGYYFTPSALGASGAVNAIVAFEVLLYPLRTIWLYMVVPVPSILLGGMFLLRDLVGIQDGNGSGVAHAGHLGGAAVGALALAQLRLRRRIA